MATGAGGGKRPQRRLPLADLTNLSSSASASASRLKVPAQSLSCTSTGSSTRCPPPAPAAAEIKGKDKSTRELQSSNCQLKKIKKISKPKVKTGDTLPDASSPPSPSKKTRKTTKEQQHREPLDHKFGDSPPTQDFIEKQRAYFAEIDAFELVEEFVSGSDIE